MSAGHHGQTLKSYSPIWNGYKAREAKYLAAVL